MRRAIRSVLYNRSWVLDILVAALLIATIYFLVGQRNLSDEIKTLAEQNRHLNEQTVELGKRINDCTSPQGTCYQQNTQRSAAVVQQLNNIAIITAACTDKTGEQTAEEIRQCALKVLKSK